MRAGIYYYKVDNGREKRRHQHKVMISIFNMNSQTMRTSEAMLNTSIDMNVTIRLSGVEGMPVEGMDYLGL